MAFVLPIKDYVRIMLICLVQYGTATVYDKTRKLCYRKDDRAMRAI